MHLSYRIYRKLFVVLLATLVISALAAGPGVAAKGGRNKSTAGSGKCSVAPNPVSNDVAGYYTVNGSGFGPYGGLNVFVVSPSGAEVQTLMPVADSAGNFAQMDWAPFLIEDGQWSVYIFQSGDSRMTLLASCSFQVT